MPPPSSQQRSLSPPQTLFGRGAPGAPGASLPLPEPGSSRPSRGTPGRRAFSGRCWSLRRGKLERAPRKRSEIAGRKSSGEEEEGLSGGTTSPCCRLRRPKPSGRAGLNRANRGELPGHRRSPREARSDAHPESRGRSRLSLFPLSRRRSGPRSGQGLS